MPTLRKARAQFELCPLRLEDPEAVDYPPSAVECSQRALETLFALTTEVEELRMTCKLSLTDRTLQ